MVKISVVIKALNEESNIARAVESSLGATASRGGEVILADSGSSDRTVEKAAAFPITIVELCHPEERSCGVSQQLGYQHSRGEYVYLLDGDMDLSAAFLDEAMKLLDSEPRVAGVGGYIREMQIANHEFEHRSKRLVRARRTHPAEVGHLNGGGLYRRAAIEEVQYLSDRNLHTNEEFDLGLRLRVRGWRLIRLGSRAADHYGHAMKSYPLLLHRARSGYILGSGEVLRAGMDGGYLLKVLAELRPLRAYGFAVALWGLALLVMLWFPGWWGIAGLAALYLLPIGAMMLRHRSINLGFYTVAVWQVQAYGLVRGLFRKRRSPTEPIASRVVQTGTDHPGPRPGSGAQARSNYNDCRLDAADSHTQRTSPGNDHRGVAPSGLCRSESQPTKDIGANFCQSAAAIQNDLGAVHHRYDASCRI